MSGITLRQDLALRLSAQLELENHWNRKLKAGKGNPFPLAPRKLSEGIINEENYLQENLSFGGFSSDIMTGQIDDVTREAGAARTNLRVEILGAGLCRDLGWVRDAKKQGFIITIREVCQVGCDSVSNILCPEFVKSGAVRVKKGEIEETWSDGEFDAPQSVIYFASQFIQVQSRPKMQRIMKRFGSILANQSPAYPDKRIYLVHPFRKDNVGQKEWGSHRMLVVWGDTRPYDEGELIEAVEKSGAAVACEILGTHAYYHQTYSLIRIMKREPERPAAH